MGEVIIKAEPDVDLYVVWSTECDAPLYWGTRNETRDWIDQRHHQKFPNQPYDQTSHPDFRLLRAAQTGTSAVGAFGYFGRWDDEGIIYEQRGFLPRRHLAEACRLLQAGKQPAVWDLLVPFDDREVRRG